MHSLLEVLPLAAVALIASVHWGQFLALFGAGGEAADFSLRLKADPLPVAYIAALLTTLAVLVVAPYAEELWRCARVQGGGRIGRFSRERSPGAP